jgi:hypothetical protein
MDARLAGGLGRAPGRRFGRCELPNEPDFTLGKNVKTKPLALPQNGGNEAILAHGKITKRTRLRDSPEKSIGYGTDKVTPNVRLRSGARAPSPWADAASGGPKTAAR